MPTCNTGRWWSPPQCDLTSPKNHKSKNHKSFHRTFSNFQLYKIYSLNQWLQPNPSTTLRKWIDNSDWQLLLTTQNDKREHDNWQRPRMTTDKSSNYSISPVYIGLRLYVYLCSVTLCISVERNAPLRWIGSHPIVFCTIFHPKVSMVNNDSFTEYPSCT